MIEAFLVLEQPRQRLTHWGAVLAPLDDVRAPRLAAISAYYDPSTDEALIGLLYNTIMLGRDQLRFVVEIAMLAEIGVIQPAELTEGDRRRFLGERLGRCAIHLVNQATVGGALTELVRRVRAHKEASAPKAAGAPDPVGAPKEIALARPPAKPMRLRTVPPPIPAARGLPRGDTADPVMLIKARGTRDDLQQASVPHATRRGLPTHNDLADVIDGPARERSELPRASRRDETMRATSPNVISRVHRAPTVEVAPPQMVAPPRPDTVPAHGPLPTPSPGRSVPAVPDPARGGIIYARYLRGGRWVPTRIGALSLKGAALMAGALPRLQDQIDIALAFGGQRALVRGAVGKVSTTEQVAQSGAATFSVAFQLDDASRGQLTALLTAARTANVTIKPPPPRQACRYPVEWSVCLGTNRGAVKGEALDVSRDGMFVRPQHALTVGANLTFSAVLDDNAASVSGRARVVRQIGEDEARRCGLVAGYGLCLTEMGDADLDRWFGFLTRIEKRSEKRILVGAAPARLVELQAALVAVGYSVTGGTDPGALVQMAAAGARPVDVALIDAGWLGPEMSAGWVESLFEARKVPCMTVQGDARRARSAIDKLLLAP